MGCNKNNPGHCKVFFFLAFLFKVYDYTVLQLSDDSWRDLLFVSLSNFEMLSFSFYFEDKRKALI